MYYFPITFPTDMLIATGLKHRSPGSTFPNVYPGGINTGVAIDTYNNTGATLSNQGQGYGYWFIFIGI